METTGVGRFAALMDQWRQSLRLNNLEFATRLGRSKSEWSQVQRGRRRVTRTLAARVLARADEPWRSAFERALAADLAESATSAMTEG